MKLVQFDLGGIQFLRKRECWLGKINMTLGREGEAVMHNVEVKVRAKGSLSQTYQEGEAAIQAEAIEVLSQAIDTLRQKSAGELYSSLDK